MRAATEVRTRRRAFPFRAAVIGTIPMIIVAVGVYVIGILFTFYLSFTNSKLFASYHLVGFDQYRRLWSSDRWLIAVHNIWVFGALSIICNMVFGYLLAVFMDQRIRQEDLLRSIFLYPFAMSLIVTGLVWQWILDPNLGIEQTLHNLGWTSFHFSPLVEPKVAIYGLVVAGIWQGSGVTMAILLAGLRGVDEDLWKAARVDGIPTWRVYLSIVLPILRPMLITATVLLSIAVVKVYDLVVAMTNGGPGIASEMPAKFVMDHLFERANVGLATACATFMLVTVIAVLAPWLYSQYGSPARRRAA
jgi:glucose/mannose transport system permease protein